jgi:hypothetical protein
MYDKNRINNCKKNLGKIYRIFNDLYDMGWLEKINDLYKVIKNSIEKIVKVFEKEKGIVYKDERGIMKIKVVEDWNVKDGLKRNKE